MTVTFRHLLSAAADVAQAAAETALAVQRRFESTRVFVFLWVCRGPLAGPVQACWPIQAVYISFRLWHSGISLADGRVCEYVWVLVSCGVPWQRRVLSKVGHLA